MLDLSLAPIDRTGGEFTGSNPVMYGDWDVWGFDWDFSGPLQIPTDLGLVNTF